MKRERDRRKGEERKREREEGWDGESEREKEGTKLCVLSFVSENRTNQDFLMLLVTEF
jgi:hypothetical protein